MSAGTKPCGCRYCADKAVQGEQAPATEPAPTTVELPAAPRRFRVHFPAGRIQDCTLHPDGTIESEMAGQLWRCGLTYEEMHVFGGWRTARIEWDPADTPDAELAEPALESTGRQASLFSGEEGVR